ncbi:hypothetical protein AADZ91_15160 [Colwelliaceae bacterium 6441]
MNTFKQINLVILSIVFCLINGEVLADEAIAHKTEQAYEIPSLGDAKIFAQFTDELPAVINYFTDNNEQAIIDFYQKIYGEPTSSVMKRGRLALYFSAQDKQLRVIISPQGKRFQVDILLNEQ